MAFGNCSSSTSAGSLTSSRHSAGEFRMYGKALWISTEPSKVSARHSRRPKTTWTVSSVESLLNDSLLWRNSRNSCKMIRKTCHRILCSKVSKTLSTPPSSSLSLPLRLLTTHTLFKRNGLCCGTWSRSLGDVPVSPLT